MWILLATVIGSAITFFGMYFGNHYLTAAWFGDEGTAEVRLFDVLEALLDQDDGQYGILWNAWPILRPVSTTATPRDEVKHDLGL